MIMTMIVVNVHEAKARLSEYLEAASRGERILICKRNQPVAELRAVESARTAPRPLGGGPHRFDIDAAFFEPLPETTVRDFESGGVYPESRAQAKPAHVAERRASPSPRRRR